MARTVKAAPAPRISAQERQWRAQDDLRTLQQAEKIRGDKGRLDAAKREAQAQIKAIAKVAAK